MLDVSIEVDWRTFHLDVEFSVAAGERLALFGPSGAGKTTSLEVVAGLVRPQRGKVVLAGTDLSRVPPYQRRVGLLRQDPGLFPHLTVKQNVLYSANARTLASNLINETLTALELTELLSSSPRQLSGGQRHRVALARMLLAGHDVLLFDEPYTGLDARLRKALTDTVRNACAERGVPGVLVSHFLEDAQAFADRLAVLDNGRLLQIGSPSEVVRRPATRRVAELVGYTAFLPGAGSVVAVHPDRVISGVHSESGFVVAGPVAVCRPKGTGWEAEIDVSGDLVGCVFPDEPPRMGERVSVTVVDPPRFALSGELLEPVATVARDQGVVSA